MRRLQFARFDRARPVAHQTGFIMRMLTLSAVILGCALATSAQQRPLITEDVDIISPGTMRVQAGVDFVQRQRYTVSGLEGDLTRAGVLGLTFGLAPNVEIQIQGVAQNFLSINSRTTSSVPLDLAANANSTHDTGDFTLWTKVKLRNETGHWPSVGFRFGVQ